MNTFELIQCLKNDVRVRLMFNEMVFDPSLYNNFVEAKLARLSHKPVNGYSESIKENNFLISHTELGLSSTYVD